MKRRVRWLGLVCAIGLVLGAAVPALAKQSVTGAVYTTVKDCSVVNKNIYDSKDEVHLSGGPDGDTALGPDGDWYFQVTEPSGKTLLTIDNIEERRFEVRDGKIVNYLGSTRGVHPCTGDKFAIELMDYENTPNKGGEYKLWLTPVATYNPNAKNGNFGFVGSFSVTDNFKVRMTDPDPGPDPDDPPPALCEQLPTGVLSLGSEVAVTGGGPWNVTFTHKIKNNATDGTLSNVKLQGYADEKTWATLAAGAEATMNEAISGVISSFSFTIVASAEVLFEEETCPLQEEFLVKVAVDGMGVVVVEKYAHGALPHEKWGFEANGTSFDLGDGETYELVLPAGTAVTIKELPLPEGSEWELTGIICEKQQHDIENRSATVTVAEKQTVTCTFYNDYDGHRIIVGKVTDPKGNRTPFTFTLDRLADESDESSNERFDPVTVPGGETHVWAGLEGGRYVLTEQKKSGWGLTGLVCRSSSSDSEGEPDWLELDIDKAKRSAGFWLTEGDTVFCTFTNKQDIPTGGEDDKPNDPTPIPSPTPQAQPEPEPDSEQELPPPPPTAQPDLPRTGGTFLWHLLGGTGLTIAGGSAWMRRRRKGA